MPLMYSPLSLPLSGSGTILARDSTVAALDRFKEEGEDDFDDFDLDAGDGGPLK